ncbi:Glucose--fructose oxidoreductase [Pontiella desulfatans]|uniref:Glucose--fructose oxidoreductase n=1 Tax=Pontiella desulfatans TaxID=2750659 RepID=A0A6C2UD64_PONDE|nr:Gfo/Idh/MocA family oxidoreductase [Pontiella desulfatans]VGO17793.1 Glucose--fructose oxidoreductase [Pontiella desulfatans]
MNNRRTLLKTSAVAGTAFSILPAWGQAAPSKRVNMAMIGVGRQGTNANMGTFLGMDNVRVVAVCDVDRLRMVHAKKKVDERYGDTACKIFGDFREALELPGLDAVMVSTTDHWHAIIALAAMKKGLHVCCEKAMTRYFDEGRALADMAKKSGVVFRLDSECRSHAYMQKTANLVKNGYIGNITRMEVGVPVEFQKGGGDPAVVPVPEYLDYEMWQGPARLRPYSVDRVHKTNPETGAWMGRPGWLRLQDYCSGMICNWGGHLIDVANFINGTSHTGPVSCEGAGSFDSGGLWDTINAFELQYKYANGVVMDYKIKVPYLRIEGDEGWIQAHWHSEGGLQAHNKEIFRTKFRETDTMVPSRSDKRDFISAITEGTPVMIDAEAGHRVNSQCLLGLATVKAGTRLEWDPKTEKVTNSAKGEAAMKETYHRGEWKLENFI